MTPIDKALSVRVSARVEEVVDLLRTHGFDQAPVSNGKQIVGFVTRRSAEEAAPGSRIRVQRLASPFLVSADAPVGILMRRLMDAPVVFAIEKEGLAGFVTPSDLNKHPVRTHFYLLLADLEMTMASLARSNLSSKDHALDCLPPGRLEKVREQHDEAMEYNVDADVWTAFQFSDLLTAMRKSGLHSEFGYPSQTKWLKATSRLTSFRDQVMHPTSDFLGRRTIPELVAFESQLRSMLVAAGGR